MSQIHNAPPAVESWWEKVTKTIGNIFLTLKPKISSFKQSFLGALPKKIPLGLTIYISLAIFLLYSFYPKSGESEVGETVMSFFLLIGFLIGCVAIFFMVNAWSKRRKEKREKANATATDKNKVVTQPNFWFCIQTYLMFAVGAVFFSMLWKMDMMEVTIATFNQMSDPSKGMVYLPIFGLFVAGLGGALILLLTESCSGSAKLNGYLLAPILITLSWLKLWLMPWAGPHNVIIPALQWLGLSGNIPFPADPQVPTWWVGATLVLLFVLMNLIKKWERKMWLQYMVIYLAIVMFGLQWLWF